jgi:undecaprenyl-diphosphatase
MRSVSEQVPTSERATVGEVVADAVAERTEDSRVAPAVVRVFRELDAVDREVYAAIARTPTPTIDAALRQLSDAANFSGLWMGVAGGLALGAGRRGRRAAVEGLAAIGLTSAVVNQGIKPLLERGRPNRENAGVVAGRHVRMPMSTSFPSGHSASAFAFAGAVSEELPLLSLPLRFLAGAVAYSRVHTGVHYPGDALVGAIIGGAVAAMTRDVVRLAFRRR